MQFFVCALEVMKMSEQQTSVKKDMVRKNDMGMVRLDEEVIASIASITIGEIEGVADTVGGVSYSLTGMLGKKNGAKGVRVDTGDEGISININITVKYGHSIPELARHVQQRISEEVQKMTGMKVSAVDIFVQGIVF